MTDELSKNVGYVDIGVALSYRATFQAHVPAIVNVSLITWKSINLGGVRQMAAGTGLLKYLMR